MRQMLKIALAVTLIAPSGLLAQKKGTAVLVGTVTDTLQRPIEGVEVRVSGVARPIRTDSSGRFVVSDLSGRVSVAVRRIGYGPVEESVRLTNNDTTKIRILLRAGTQELSAMIVESKRAAVQSLTADQIARTPWTTVGQLFLHKRTQLFGLKPCEGDIRVFINGEQWPMWRLSAHPVDDIAEMHFIDCWNRVTPRLRMSLIVNLKPGIPP